MRSDPGPPSAGTDGVPRRPAPSIHDVARQAGVSATTVSHALSGNRPVNAGTAARVRAAATELGYVPASTARHLRAGRTEVIGLLVPDIANTFFGRLARGVADTAQSQGFALILCHTDFDPTREDEHLDLLRSRFIDGLVYAAGSPPSERRLGTLASSFPIVLADEDVPDLAGAGRVGGDHRLGGRLAGSHLWRLGHREALVLTGPPGLPSSDQRVAGFRDHFDDVVLEPGDFSERGGYQAVSRALAQGQRFSAVFAVNDLMAVGALTALHEFGLDVPAEVSVVGYDDIELVDRLNPGLTTISQPAYDIGAAAAQQLLDRLVGGSEPVETVLPVDLVVRGTTGRAAPTPSRAAAAPTRSPSEV